MTIHPTIFYITAGLASALWITLWSGLRCLSTAPYCDPQRVRGHARASVRTPQAGDGVDGCSNHQQAYQSGGIYSKQTAVDSFQTLRGSAGHRDEVACDFWSTTMYQFLLARNLSSNLPIPVSPHCRYQRDSSYCTYTNCPKAPEEVRQPVSSSSG